MNLTDKIAILVAGLRINFLATDGVRFSEEARHFYGYATDATEDSDMVVVVRPSTSKAVIDAVESTEADPIAAGLGKYRWMCGKLVDGREFISVEFSDGRQATLKFGSEEAELELLGMGNEVHPYIFPLFPLFLSRLLARCNGFLIHSSVVNYHEKGYLFSGRSGMGKSTIAGLFGECGAMVVHDDMVAIRDGVAYSYPSKPRESEPRSVRLSAAFVISHGRANESELLDRTAGALSLMQNTIYTPYNSEVAVRHLRSIASLDIPIHKLAYCPTKEIVSYVDKLAESAPRYS